MLTAPPIMTNLKMKASDLKDNLLPRRRANVVVDTINVMRTQETTAFKVHDFLKNKDPAQADGVDMEVRTNICDWAYSVIDYCGFSRETVAIAMNYLDRYVATKDGRMTLNDKEDYQVASMTTIYMAIKLFEPLDMDLDLLADMSSCKEERFVRRERDILKALDWRIQGPTALSFVTHFMDLFPTAGVVPAVAGAIMESARFQTELSITDYQLVQENPSDIAFACILNACDQLNEVALPDKLRRQFVKAIEFYSKGVTCQSVEHIRYRLGEMMHNSRPPSVQSRIRHFSKEENVVTTFINQKWTVPSAEYREASPVCVSKARNATAA